MNWFSNIFGGQPNGAQGQPPAPASTSNNPAQNQPPANPASSAVTAPNGVVPPGGDKKPEESPTAKFATLWEPNKTDEPKPGEQPQGLTPEKMLEAASKVDFTKALNRELVEKLQAGGTDAVQATLALMNQTAQQVYGQSVVVSQKLVEKAIAEARQEFASQVPGMMKRQSAQEALVQSNPAFKDPAVAPVVAAVQQQLQQKYPNATSAEIAELAQDYFKNAAGVFAGKPPESATKPTGAEADFDWEGWIQTPMK